MARIASAADFEQGGLYTAYRRYPFFAERADFLTRRYPELGTVLVVGCGWGYLVDELETRGWDAWGADASAYAIARGQAELPHLEGRLFRADVTDARHLDLLMRRTDPPIDRFDLVVTEDLLPALDDDEIARALAALRGVGRTLVHIVTPGDDRGGARHSDLNWKPIAAWRSLLAPDAVLDAETGEVA
jgi:cyclopropane fatty-acyl-phospholipid synthase-like methyltransferase